MSSYHSDIIHPDATKQPLTQLLQPNLISCNAATAAVTVW
ncbi:hypothetical protein OROGR_017329 [Orobanche gracilis]